MGYHFIQSLVPARLRMCICACGRYQSCSQSRVKAPVGTTVPKTVRRSNSNAKGPRPAPLNSHLRSARHRVACDRDIAAFTLRRIGRFWWNTWTTSNGGGPWVLPDEDETDAMMVPRRQSWGKMSVAPMLGNIRWKPNEPRGVAEPAQPQGIRRRARHMGSSEGGPERR
jgi:hypothetical protein